MSDPADAPIDAPHWDRMVIEECNHYRDPCAGPHGDATPYDPCPPLDLPTAHGLW